MIRENQADYYKAIEQSTEKNDSGIFAEFMLQTILDAIKKHKNKNVQGNVQENVQEKTREELILELLQKNNAISIRELAEQLNVTTKTIQRDLDKLKSQNLIRRVGPDKGGHWEIVKSD